MQRALRLIALSLTLGACGSETPPAANVPPPADAPARSAAAPGQTTAAAPTAPTQAASNPVGATLAGRSGELINPDNRTMVLLYYDLTAIKPPIDKWVEDDPRVRGAPGPEKAARRETVRAELESAAEAVRNVGVIRLSLGNANLSDYDPTYGEFTVRALAPSSVVEFKALGENVGLRFANGKTAQIWRVAPEQAQVIRDKIGPYGQASLEVQIQITGALPSPGGGTIATDVVEYELHDVRSGVAIARNRL